MHYSILQAEVGSRSSRIMVEVGICTGGASKTPGTQDHNYLRDQISTWRIVKQTLERTLKVWYNHKGAKEHTQKNIK